ncbi:YARHG domain-containing protein, partial [Hungatella effluvii]|uniref:YARHG domain-containing protein n=1 Tax=Hungatella effluvii TaxID=1096246 RepID=UPI002A7FBB60
LQDAVPHSTVDGDARLEGDYYSFQRSFSRPEVFTRYLSKADLYLYPTEDLWLLRNEIYAAHGRKFDSEVLSQYFSNEVCFRIPCFLISRKRILR